MKYTTTNLSLTARDFWRIHERTIRDGAWAGAFVTTLLLIHSLLSPQPAPAAQPLYNVQEQVRPIIIVQTVTAQPTLAPQPTMTPWPTPEPVVIVQQVEVPAPPIVEYVEVPVQVYVPVEAPPTLAPPVEPEPEPPPLQTLVMQSDEEPMSPALLREAMDQ